MRENLADSGTAEELPQLQRLRNSLIHLKHAGGASGKVLCKENKVQDVLLEDSPTVNTFYLPPRRKLSWHPKLLNLTLQHK